MAAFSLNKEELSRYEVSLAGMKRKKHSLKIAIKRTKEGDSKKLDREYKLELLNVIEGYMRTVIKYNRNNDHRLDFQNRR